MPSWRMKETNLSNGKLSSPNNTRVTNWNHSIKRAAFRRVKVLDGHTAWSTNDAPVWQVHGHNAPQKGLETINMAVLRRRLLSSLLLLSLLGQGPRLPPSSIGRPFTAAIAQSERTLTGSVNDDDSVVPSELRQLFAWRLEPNDCRAEGSFAFCGVEA